MQEKLGREVADEDVVYHLYEEDGQKDSAKTKWVAQVRLAGLPNDPRYVGLVRSTKEAAIRVAAFTALEGSKAELKDEKWEEKKEEAEDKEDGAAKQAPAAEVASPAGEKTPEVEGPAADGKDEEPLEVGMNVTGVVTSALKDGSVLVNIGRSRELILSPEEFRDGFPLADRFPSKGSRISARVLATRSGQTRPRLTRRSGDLARPRKEALPDVDPSLLADVPPAEWLQGEVVRMTLSTAIVEVAAAAGAQKTVGIVPRSDLSESFTQAGKLGDMVNVRVKLLDVKKKQILLSMKDTIFTPVSELKVGQVLSGTVSLASGRSKGIFVDVGAARDGLLTIEEFRDGFPTGMNKVRTGSKMMVRVLRTDGDYFWLTRRGGDLTRSKVPPAEGKVSQFARQAREEWMDGIVSGMNERFVLVDVRPSGGGGELTRGILRQREFAGAFADEANIGDSVRVRVLTADPDENRLELSMKFAMKEEPAKRAAEDTETFELLPLVESQLADDSELSDHANTDSGLTSEEQKEVDAVWGTLVSDRKP